jgi:Cdc6-like AAA superfamily ATPase
MKEKREKTKLYPDRPETKENLKFAHTVLVDWFEELILDISPPFRIAITGDLGTGKSTMIYNALEALGKQKKYKVAYVDVWKLDKTSARRSTILRVAKQFKIDLKKYKELKQSIYGSVSEASDIKATEGLGDDRPWYQQWIYWLMVILSLALGYLVYYLFNKYDSGNETISDLMKIIAGLAVATYSLITNIIARKVLQVKSTVGKDPYVGPEEFEEAFQTILNDPVLDKKIAVVVFDNIDRAPKSKTEEILTGISTFFDHSAHDELRNIIIIVPFSNRANKELDEQTVQKFFDAIVPLPNLMPEDLMDYTEEKLDGISWKDEAKEIAQLIDQSSLETPRSILHFINEINAQLSLASKLEKEKHVAEGGGYETYLPPQSITGEKVFFAKLKLCEKNYKGFLEEAIREFLSPKEAMNFERFDYKEEVDPSEDGTNGIISKEKIEMIEQRKSVLKFLRSTEGIPSNYPESLGQFAYFKGSDLELSVPGGTRLIKALTNRSVEEVEEFIKVIDVEALEKIFKYSITKNIRNPQRVKNAIHSILDSFTDDIPSKVLRNELSMAILGVKDIVDDIEISDFQKISPLSDGKVENSEVWKIVDEKYKKIMTDENVKLVDHKDWRKEYLIAMLGQSSGFERSKITSNLILANDFLDLEIFDAINDNGLKKYVGKGNVENVFKLVQGNAYLFEDNIATNLGIVLNTGISNVGVEDAAFAQEHFTNAWAAIAALIGEHKKLFELIKSMFHLYKPLSDTKKVPDACWQVFFGFQAQHAHIAQMVESENKHIIVSFLLLVNSKYSIAGQTNIVPHLKTFITKSNYDDFKVLTKFYGGWEWIVEARKFLQVELKAKLGDTNFLLEMCKDASSKGADFLMSERDFILGFKNFEAIFSDISDDEKSKLNKNDFCKYIFENESEYDFSTFKPCLHYLSGKKDLISDINVEKDISRLFDGVTSEEECDFLIVWCQKNKLPLLNQKINEFKEHIIGEETTIWNLKESLQFYTCVKGAKDRSDDFYETMFDKAVERGVYSGADVQAVKRVSTVLLNSWKVKNGIKKVDLLIQYKGGIEKNSLLTDEDKKEIMTRLEEIAGILRLKKQLGFSKNLKDKIKSILPSNDDDK